MERNNSEATANIVFTRCELSFVEYFYVKNKFRAGFYRVQGGHGLNHHCDLHYNLKCRNWNIWKKKKWKYENKKRGEEVLNAQNNLFLCPINRLKLSKTTKLHCLSPQIIILHILTKSGPDRTISYLYFHNVPILIINIHKEIIFYGAYLSNFIKYLS